MRGSGSFAPLVWHELPPFMGPPHIGCDLPGRVGPATVARNDVFDGPGGTVNCQREGNPFLRGFGLDDLQEVSHTTHVTVP